MNRLARAFGFGIAALLTASILPPLASATPRVGEPAYSLSPNRCPLPTLKSWECFTLDVPMDWWHRGNGERADIAVAVHRATVETRGTLTLNAGGPGSSSLLIADQVLLALPAEIQRSFDIVL